MSLNSWLSSLKQSSRRRNRKATRRHGKLMSTRKMFVEGLEDRRLLAGLNLITNGSFETPDLPSGANGGPGNVPGWENGPGSITNGIVSNYITELGTGFANNVDGEQLVALLGHDLGWTLEQAVSTTAGVEHALSFWYGKAGDWFLATRTRGEVYLASDLSTPIADTGFLNPGLSPPGTDRTDLFQTHLTFTPAEDDLVIRFTEDARRRTFALLDNGVLTVNNTPPVAQDDEIMTDEDSPVTFNVLVDNGHGPDSDAEGNLDPSLTVDLTSPALGDLTDNGNGSFTYDPDALFESLADGEFTTQTFTYQIEDIFGEIATATVDIKITGENDAPTAIGTLSDVTVNQNAANSVISLTGLFDDVDANDTLTITAVSSSSGLVTAGVSGNSLTLDYQANQSGTATITVTATDGLGASVDLTFDVAVLSPNDLANGIIQLIQQWKTDGKINAGVANSMIVKVVNSLKSYDKGNLTAAGNQLTALKNEISAKVKPGSLTLADALLANGLIDALYDSMTP